MSVKISNVSTHVLGTPWRNLTYVVVETDEGLRGVGEVRMLNHTDALIGYLGEAVGNHVLGSDPFDIESLVSRMYHNDFGRAGEIVMSGIAVIEMACWDIIGKALNQPVYRLLGGAVRDKIKAYANGWYTVERTPEEFHTAAKKVVDYGYQALKFDPFGPGRMELDHAETVRSIELVEAVRDAVGPEVELLVEMHGRFTAATASRIARLLRPYDPAWLEEPTPPDDIEALAKFSATAEAPVATGERLHTRHEFRQLFALQAADIVQADISHFGGILELKKLAATAETHHMMVAPHNVGGAVLTAANLHLAACTTNFKIQEHFNDFSDAFVKDVAPGNPEVVDGYFALPTGPGLGVELDLDLVAEHPRQKVNFNLFKDGWQRRDTVSQ
ncbi:galactonate dehydratase [Actinoalloteichus hymeniacidonis]|nr:galactonate dehydratase [Actinoalloteichus hymeniacidonis]